MRGKIILDIGRWTTMKRSKEAFEVNTQEINNFFNKLMEDNFNLVSDEKLIDFETSNFMNYKVVEAIDRRLKTNLMKIEETTNHELELIRTRHILKILEGTTQEKVQATNNLGGLLWAILMLFFPGIISFISGSDQIELSVMMIYSAIIICICIIFSNAQDKALNKVSKLTFEKNFSELFYTIYLDILTNNN